MQVHISNRWTLKPSEVQALVDNGRGTSINWWCRNLTSDGFVKYEQQLGGQRIPGDKPFEADLDLEPGEYQFGCGKWDVIDSTSGRHCSQKFYVLVDNEGAHVLKRDELPSQGGTGRPAQTSFNGSGNGWNKSSGWGKSSGWDKAREDYYVFPSFRACLYDMVVHPESDWCSSCAPKPGAEGAHCSVCEHGLPVYVKRDRWFHKPFIISLTLRAYERIYHNQNDISTEGGIVPFL